MPAQPTYKNDGLKLHDNSRVDDSSLGTIEHIIPMQQASKYD